MKKLAFAEIELKLIKCVSIIVIYNLMRINIQMHNFNV